MTGLERYTISWPRRCVTAYEDAAGLTFGTREWAHLSDDDPRKVAAAVRAGACWFDTWRDDRIAERLSDEFAVTEQLRAQEWAAVAALVRRRASSPPWSQITRRWAS